MTRAQETVAIVVGVEAYSAGPTWNLNGPALDACRFAKWLDRSGVPKGNITMLLSPLIGNVDKIDEMRPDFNIRVATAENVRRVFVNELHDRSSDLLIIYWGGHGVMEDGDIRRLLYADAANNDKRNLNLTSLLKALRSSTYRNHPKQFVVVDACLSHAEELGWRGLPDEKFQHANDSPIGEQYSLFAASPGERARNDDARQTGIFSAVLLAEISWPPDPELLRDTVRKQFESLRGFGDVHQSPSDIWYQSGSAENRQLFHRQAEGAGPNIPALRVEMLTRAELRQLENILTAAPGVPRLPSIFREATYRLRLDLPKNVNNLMDYIYQLCQPATSFPLLEFLIRFAAAVRINAPSAADRLDLWVDTTARRWGLDVTTLREIRSELRNSAVLVKLERDPQGKGWQVSAWTYSGAETNYLIRTDEPWGRDELGELLSRQFEIFVDDFTAMDGSTQLTVEFLLGIDLLEEDLETLRVNIRGEVYEVGMACPVVVRSLDRLAEEQTTDLWHSKWRELMQRGGSYDGDAICYVTEKADLEAAASRLCAALACHPSADRQDLLRAAMRTGTPVALWHRSTGIHPGRRNALASVLDSWGLLRLPERVMRQRMSARDPNTLGAYSGKDLVLLWDDPGRVPEELQWHDAVREGAEI